MISVILLIFKIIGITLLIIIGLLIAILLTVLIVPIRYRVQAEHGEDKLYVRAKVSWFLHLLRIKAAYENDVLHIRVRVLWFTLLDNLDPKTKKSNKKNRKNSRKKAKRNSNTKTESMANRSKSNQITGDKIPNSLNVENSLETEQEKETLTNMGSSQSQQQKTIQSNGNLDQKTEENNKSEQTSNSYWRRFKNRFLRVKNTIIKWTHKIIHIKDKIIAFFQGMKARIIKWCNTIRNLKNKFNLILDFMKDELNKEGFQITYSSFKKLLKHILPTKLQSKIVFGTGDPCSTGQALGVMSIVYSYYGDKVRIIPDFENKILEGKHEARGRIRLVTLLMIVIKLILDKRFKQLKNNFQILKEAL